MMDLTAWHGPTPGQLTNTCCVNKQASREFLEVSCIFDFASTSIKQIFSNFLRTFSSFTTYNSASLHRKDLRRAVLRMFHVIEMMERTGFIEFPRDSTKSRVTFPAKGPHTPAWFLQEFTNLTSCND